MLDDYPDNSQIPRRFNLVCAGQITGIHVFRRVLVNHIMCIKSLGVEEGSLVVSWFSIGSMIRETCQDRKSTRLNPVTPISRMPSSA